ncbi:MAG: M20/M25/M40 family metallo-hydrolase [Bryobacteraceae bacterium]|jgi:acetylornithine deacetylase/succinyl-diaminopimelate desuccinylase-like protein
MRRILFLILLSVASGVVASAQAIDWPKVNEEAIGKLQALVQIDSSNGNETRVVEYVKKQLDAEGIPSMIVSKDPTRANIIARIKGNGSKKPLLIMGHSDTVKVDASKWTIPPFSGARVGGYIYGRGVIDDKSDLFAALMTTILLKRTGIKLDRDVIFVSEAGEEGASGFGIGYLVSDHWKDIEAEACLTEAGIVTRRGGKTIFATIETTEKVGRGARLVATGPSGHGSRPMRNSAIARLSAAIDKLVMWDPPMRLNDTTRTYFEKLATVSDPKDAQVYRDLFDPAKSAAAREYMAVNQPTLYSMLHTSISPNIIQGGFQGNVIPSEATAQLDIRAVPDEDPAAFYDLMRKVINDPQVQVVPSQQGGGRPTPPPSSITNEFYKALEKAFQNVYNVPVAPLMQTGGTDMQQLRARGVQCYGVGPMQDDEDTLKGFGIHSDQERMLEEAAVKHLQLYWQAVTAIAGAK